MQLEGEARGPDSKANFNMNKKKKRKKLQLDERGKLHETETKMIMRTKRLRQQQQTSQMYDVMTSKPQTTRTRIRTTARRNSLICDLWLLFVCLLWAPNCAGRGLLAMSNSKKLLVEVAAASNLAPLGDAGPATNERPFGE